MISARAHRDRSHTPRVIDVALERRAEHRTTG
jgi:hypothetical protein